MIAPDDPEIYGPIGGGIEEYGDIMAGSDKYGPIFSP